MAYPQERYRSTTFPDHSFWQKRQEVLRTSTLRHQLQMLKDTGRYDAFKLRWHPSFGDKPNVDPIPNHLFWDSDVAKWIEGACYLMKDEGDEEIKAAIDELVDMIADAQHEDGYLNIHFSVVDPKGRFKNLKDLHELYNCGHLIEAAVAHKQRFNEDKLLNTMNRYVDLIDQKFGAGEDKRHGYPGHPEIELALLRLFELTGNDTPLKVARFFIEERGNPKGQDGRHFYDVESEERGDNSKEWPAYYPEARSYWYHQAHLPILEQKEIMGHSVRAMYLLIAVADLVRIAKDDGDDKFAEQYKAAMETLWSNMVEKKMYLTGGIGAMDQWEGFGNEYFLPQGTDEGGCYNETCAAIGILMLAERALQLDLNSYYSDIMELSLYNATLTGMSQDGEEFTYINQLASTDRDPSKRYGWFTCACCPPNVMRVLAVIGSYLWTYDIDTEKSVATVNIHLYSSATLEFAVGGSKVTITQETDWPWDGKVNLKTTVEGPPVTLNLRVRIPGWAKEYSISPKPQTEDIKKGYMYLDPQYIKENSSIVLNFPMKPRFITPHPFANQAIIGVARGPLVYCVEDVDNTWVDDHFKSVIIDTKVPLVENLVSKDGTIAADSFHLPASYKPAPDHHVVLVSPKGASFTDTTQWKDSPYAVVPGASQARAAGADGAERKEDLVFVPYYLRANRGGKNMMRVGLRAGNGVTV